MMIRDCLAARVQEGKLTQKRMDEYMRRFEDAERLAANQGMTGSGAYMFAASRAAEEMVNRAKNDRAGIMRSVVAIDAAYEAVNGHSAGRWAGLVSVLGDNPRGQMAPGGLSVATRQRAVYSTLARFNAEFIDDARSKVIGLTRDTTHPVHVIRELYEGGATGEKRAAASANGWAASIDYGLTLLRAAGVKVGELTDWRLPQRFDPLAVRRIGKDAFVAEMEGWWRDGSLRLRDWQGDGQAYLAPGMKDAEPIVRKIINSAYDNITNDAGKSLEPGVPRGASLNDKYGRRRAFEWSTADAWLAFNRRYGVGDDGVFDLMTQHLKGLSNDIAMAQTLGPDAMGAAKTLIAMAARDGLGKGGAAKIRYAENVWMQSSGQASTPVSEGFATFGQGVRNWLTAVQLPGAILSAVTDLAFTKASAAWNGLSMTRIGAEYVKGLDPTNRAHRLKAARLGLSLEVGLRNIADAARDTLNDTAARLPGRMAEVVIRGQGLAIHTQAARDAVGIGFQATFADLASRGFDKLPVENRRTLTTYGITAAEWDILRNGAMGPPEPGMAGFLDPARMAVEGGPLERDAALKFIGAIAAESRMAIPEGNTLSRAFLLGRSQPGTAGGEFRRGAAQYKSFPVAVMIMHFGRALDQIANPDGSWFRGSYMAGLIVGTTSLGALALNLKNIAAGKNPEAPDWSDPAQAGKFWARAFMQGGGAGIFGDFLMQSVSSRSGRDIAGTIAGPQIGLAADTLNYAFGNAGQYYNAEKTNLGRETVRFTNRYIVPDMVYTRLAMDRLIWDNLQKMVDPDAHQTFQRQIERTRKDQQTDYWWAPGRSAPSGPPNFSPRIR